MVDAGSGSQKRLEVVMGMPSIDLADEEETVVEPPASIIGEFYPRETHRSEPAASFFREESI